jgi:hypothetical protein
MASTATELHCSPSSGGPTVGGRWKPQTPINRPGAAASPSFEAWPAVGASTPASTPTAAARRNCAAERPHRLLRLIAHSSPASKLFSRCVTALESTPAPANCAAPDAHLRVFVPARQSLIPSGAAEQVLQYATKVRCLAPLGQLACVCLGSAAVPVKPSLAMRAASLTRGSVSHLLCPGAGSPELRASPQLDATANVRPPATQRRPPRAGRGPRSTRRPGAEPSRVARRDMLGALRRARPARRRKAAGDGLGDGAEPR